MTGFDEILKQARDLNHRAAAFHAQAEETHAKDRVGQLYFKVFVVALIVIGVALATGAAGWTGLSTVAIVIGGGLVLILVVLFAIHFVQNLSHMVRDLRQRRGPRQ